MTGDKKLTILVKKPLTYTELMIGGPSVFRNRKLIEVQVDPITLPYGLWERAEGRHRGSTPVMKTLSAEEKAQIKAVMWARYWDKREVRKNWFARTYGRAV